VLVLVGVEGLRRDSDLFGFDLGPEVVVMLNISLGLEEVVMKVLCCSSSHGLEELGLEVDGEISMAVAVACGMILVHRWSGVRCIACEDTLSHLPSRLHRCSCGMVPVVDSVSESVLSRFLPSFERIGRGLRRSVDFVA